MPPFDIQVLLPSMRICEGPSGVAVVASAATSEPASGSDSAKAAMARPAHRRQIARFESAEPKSEIEPVPRPCMAKAKSARPSRKARTSRARHSVRTSSRGCSPALLGRNHRVEEPASPSALHPGAAGFIHVVVGQRRQRRVGPARELAAKRRCPSSKNGQLRVSSRSISASTVSDGLAHRHLGLASRCIRAAMSAVA